MSAESDALAAIHGAFADPITYTGAGLTEGAITAVYSDVAADPFGPTKAAERHVTFEIPAALLPSDPDKGNLIVHSTGNWSVIDVVKRRDIGCWVLGVEIAAEAVP